MKLLRHHAFPCFGCLNFSIANHFLDLFYALPGRSLHAKALCDQEMPAGRWYWNLPLVSMLLILVPLAVVFVLYHLKMRAVRRQQMIDSLLSECV